MKTHKKELKEKIKRLKTAIASTCLQCVCYQPMEVLRCEIDYCPLYSERPVTLLGLYTLAKKLKKAEAKNREFEVKSDPGECP